MSIASRIEAIEQHLTDDYSVLTLAGVDLTNVDKNILNLKTTWQERLLYFINNGTDVVWNNWDKVTGEGEQISLNNTLEGKMKIDLKGNTYQEGTPTPESPQDIHVVSGDNTINVEGKNILKLGFSNDNGKLAGLDFTHTDSTFTLSGTTSATYKSLIMENLPKLVKGNTYTISRNTIGICPRLFITMNFYNSSNTRIFQMRLTGSQTSSTATFDSEEEITDVRFIVEGLSSNANYDCTIEVQIEKGTEKTTWEEYKGASYPITLPEGMFLGWIPNTDYRDKIDKSTGKNLFDKDSITWGTEETNILYYTINISNGTYTMSSPNMPVGQNNVCNLFVLPSEVSNGASSSANGVSKDQSRTLTITDGKMTIATRRTTQANTNNPYNYDWQLEKNNQATPYEPYGTSWYVNKQIGKVVLDGSESWQERTNTSGNKQFYVDITIPNVNINGSQYCTHFATYKAGLWNYGVVGDFAVMQQPHQFCGVVSSDLILADFKTSLGTNNLIAYYLLATPTYTEITDSTLLSQLNALAKSYEGQTNISQTNNDLPFIINAIALREMA